MLAPIRVTYLSLWRDVIVGIRHCGETWLSVPVIVEEKTMANFPQYRFVNIQDKTLANFPVLFW